MKRVAGRIEPDGIRKLSKKGQPEQAYLPPEDMRKIRASSDDLLEHLTQFGRKSLEKERKLPLLTRIKIALKRKLGMKV